MCSQLHMAAAPEAYGHTPGHEWLRQESSRNFQRLTVANNTGHHRGHSDPSNSMSSEGDLDERYERGRRRNQALMDQIHITSSDVLSRWQTSKRVPVKDSSSSTSDIIACDIQVVKPTHQPATSMIQSEILFPTRPLSRVLSPEQHRPPSPQTATNTTQVNAAIKNLVPTKYEITAPSNPPNPKSSFDSRTTSNSRTDGIFAREWNYIQDRRQYHMSLQAQIHGVRRNLRDKQSTKSMLEDKLFQRVMKKELGGFLDEDIAKSESESILKLLQTYQAARDDYGPLEDDCNQLEDQLYADGYDLNRLETGFFARFTVTPASNTGQTSTIKSNESTSNADDYDEEDEDLTYHPLVARYLSKLGDLDIVQERLDEIFDETEQLEDQKATRAKFGLHLGIEEQTWLDDSQRLRTEVEDQITVVAAEVEKLKQECFYQGLVDEDGEPVDLKAQEQERFGREDGLDPGSHISEYTKHPILLQQPGATNDSGSDYIPDLGKDYYYTVPGRINSWLLERLRTSALDVNLLARTYEGEGGDTSNGWQKSVLELWYKDGTPSSLADFNAHTCSIGHSTQSSTNQKSPALFRSVSQLISNESEYGTDRTVQPLTLSDHLREKQMAVVD